MEGDAMVAVPISSHSKGIKKVKPVMHILQTASHLKENARNYWQHLTKTKTVLLNDVLNKGNGVYKNGNIVIIKMSAEATERQMQHPFKNILKKEL